MGIMAATPVKAQYFRFCGNRYTADTTIPLGGGTATWNQATTTLTLKNVQAENVSDNFISCEGIAHLKIVLEGSNSVKSNGSFLYWRGGNVEISGKGSLTARSENNVAIYMNDYAAPARSPSKTASSTCREREGASPAIKTETIRRRSTSW